MRAPFMPDVTITESGRTGSVVYREAGGELSFSWEFGGRDVVAIVQPSDAASWRNPASWVAARRAAILRFVADELIRQKAPSCRAEIDETAGSIVLRQVRPAARVPEPKQFSMQTYRSLRTKLALVVLVVAALGSAAVWVKNTVFVIDPGKGTPLGSAVRTETHIATLIRTLEAYTPSLHRDHSKDTYRVSIFLVPLDGSEPKLVPIRGGLSPNSYALAKILGSDGRTLWFDAAGDGGVDLATFALRSDAEVRAAGPLPQPVRYGASFGAPKPEYHLAAGMFVGSDTWLGLHSTFEVQSHFKPKSWVRRVLSADDDSEMRRLHLGALALDTSGKHASILSMTPIGIDLYLNAAFVRPNDTSEPVRLTDPDGALMLFTSAPGLRGTTMLARVDTSGSLRWKVDTALDRFTLAQILPGERSTALVGTRLPVPDKVSEPLLVIVDNATGAVTTHSLWQ